MARPNKGDVRTVGGKPYRYDGRRWVPDVRSAPVDESGKPDRNDYPSGRQGGKEYSEAVRDWRAGRPPAQSSATSTAEQSEGGGGSGGGRGEPAPDGNGSQGTRTGPPPMTMDDANAILNRGKLKGKGFTVQNPFTSTQLPASSASAYQQENPEVNFNRELPENMYSEKSTPTLTTNLFDAGSGVTYGANIPQVPANGRVEDIQTESAPITVSSGTFTASNDEESAVTPSETEAMARRRAFLDPELGSMDALRAIEAQKGIVYTGNTYNMVNPNADQEGQNAFVQISKEDRDSYMRGQQGAEDLRKKYVDEIVEESNTDDTDNTEDDEN